MRRLSWAERLAREGVGFFHGKYLLPLSIFHYESVSQRPNFCLNIFFQMDKKAYPVLYLFDLLYCHCITDIAKMVPKHAIHKPKTGYVTYYKVLISKNFNSTSTHSNWPNSTLFPTKISIVWKREFLFRWSILWWGCGKSRNCYLGVIQAICKGNEMICVTFDKRKGENCHLLSWLLTAADSC